MDEIIIWNTTSENYQNWLYQFGIIPLLVILEKIETLEMYEECQKICDAIDKHNGLIRSFNPDNLEHQPKRIELLDTESIKSYFKEYDLSDSELMGKYEQYTRMLILEIIKLNGNKSQIA